MGRQLSAALWSFIVAIILLLVANGARYGGWAADSSMLLLGLTFVATMVAMAVASSAKRMQLSLQLLTIYFAIYLLLPGYNHASINRFPFFNFSYPPDIRTSAAAMATIFMVVVALGYATTSKTIRTPQTSAQRGRIMRNNGSLGLGLTFVSLISMVAYLQTVGLAGAFGNRSTVDMAIEDATVGNLLVGLPRIITFLPVVYGTLLSKFGLRNRLGPVLLAVNIPILLIVNFPLTLPRFQVFGALLLFALLTLDFKKVSFRAALSLAYVFGAFVAMPVLNHFSREGGTLQTLDIQQVTSSYFNTGDFDGYQSIANAVVYVDRFGHEDGLQLVSAMLFFVPRSVWAAKAQPTGSITAEAAGYTFTNISQPLPSEFYVDFGWAGVVLGGLLLGIIFCRLDHWVDRSWTTDVRARLCAGLLMGFGLPVFRGTLLGVLPPFVFLAVGLWVIARWGMTPVMFTANEPADGGSLSTLPRISRMSAL